MQNCAPHRDRKHNFETSDSKNEFERNKYETFALQIGFSMQIYNNGNEIDKNVGVMHAVVFADRALGAKSAPHCSQKQYFEEGVERKISDWNGQKSEKSKSNDKKCSYRGRLGVKKVKLLIKIA